MTWQSSDSSVVAVYNGIITAIAEGTAIVTCQFEIESKVYKDSITIYVFPSIDISSEPSYNKTAIEIIDASLDPYGNINLIWTDIKGGIEYKIYLAERDSSKYYLAATTFYTAVIISDVPPGEYKIRIKGTQDGINWTNLADCEYAVIQVI